MEENAGIILIGLVIWVGFWILFIINRNKKLEENGKNYDGLSEREINYIEGERPSFYFNIEQWNSYREIYLKNKESYPLLMSVFVEGSIELDNKDFNKIKDEIIQYYEIDDNLRGNYGEIILNYPSIGYVIYNNNFKNDDALIIYTKSKKIKIESKSKKIEKIWTRE